MDMLIWGAAALVLLAAVAALLPENLDLSHPRCSAQDSSLLGARALVLDNGPLRLSVLPEYGGRICSIYYRPYGLELLATGMTPGATPREGLTVRGGWCAAFPSLLADGELISRLSWEAEIAEQTDARAAIRLWCLVERVTHMIDGQVRVTPGTIQVERIISLQAGESAVHVEERLTNRNAWPLPTTWSAVVCLRAQAGDRAVVPVDAVEVQRGVGPSGNELDFGLLVSTPYQAFARDLREGWLGLRPAAAPVDLRLTFPRSVLPHAVIIAQREDKYPAENAFRLQPLATPEPVAADKRGGALILPSRLPVSLPLCLEIGTNILSAGEWSRPGLQLAELINAQRVPHGRLAIWRAGKRAVVVKTPAHLIFLMPEFDEDTLLTPRDLPATDLILCAGTPPQEELKPLMERTQARFIGPARLRQQLLDEGIAEERSIALSPGARFDVPGLGVLAVPSRTDDPDEHLGYLLQADNLLLYHAGATRFMGEFGPIGQQFHPQMVLLAPDAAMTMTDAIHAAKLLQPRVTVPLGATPPEEDFISRCRAQHMSFMAEHLHLAEGRMFDGWHLKPLG